MEPIEEREVAALRAESASKIQATVNSTWSERQVLATELLARANETWWRVHRLDPLAYERDLERLNNIAGWQGSHQQRAFWFPQHGARVLMPPKFFGGDPLALSERFVASMSLNHAILSPTSIPFAEELAEQQSAPDAFAAHRAYFSRPYAYAKFFRPRGEVLHSYANALGIRPAASPDEWRVLNRSFSFYIEAFPTRSTKFALPPRIPARDVLERTVFVCAINAVVHEIVLRLLRPACVLLAGQATWRLWPDAGTAAFGDNVGHVVRDDGTCRIYRNRTTSAVHAEKTTVVRTNFLRTVYGPNSTEELRLLGNRVLAK